MPRVQMTTLAFCGCREINVHKINTNYWDQEGTMILAKQRGF